MSVKTLEAPTEIIQAAQDIIDALPRKKWPNDQYDLPYPYWLETCKKNGQCQATIMMVDCGDEIEVKTWENIE